jgi:ribosomal protein L11 methyltransferase
MAKGQPLVRISVVVHPEAVEGVSDILLALGAKGVVDEGSLVTRKVSAYFPDDGKNEERLRAVEARLDRLREAGVQVGSGFVAAQVVEEEVWSEAYKAHFHAERLAPNLIVTPTWEPFQPAAGEHVLVLDPGLAFGTGGHATTRLCLRALAEQVRPGDRVADIGTGSGILAVAAALLGASRVIATDSDPAVIAIARDNAARNGVADRVEVMETDLIPGDRGPFDVVVCNILATEVIRLAPSLPALLASGGRFIGSGFIDVSVPEVTAALEAAGLHVLSAPTEHTWAAVVAEARSRRGEESKSRTAG